MADEEAGTSRSIRLSAVTLIMALLVFFIVMAYFITCGGTRSVALFPTCKNNLRNLGTQCDIYSVDNSLYFPESLEILVQKGYMKELPLCYASAGRTFLDKVYFDFRGRYISKPQMTYRLKSFGKDGVIIWCSGGYHSRVIGTKEGPAYGTASGVVDTLDLARNR
jgi:hypothetical protein